MTDADAVHEYVLDTHRETLGAVLRCADAVIERTASARAGRALAAKLERELRDAGVLEAFPALLAGGAAAAGYELPATPVPAPPYVVVTSLGPMARATLDDRWLVITVEVFAIDRSEPTERACYVRQARSPAEELTVTFRT